MPERELLLNTVTLCDERGRTHTMKYYITIDEMDTGRFFCESYGLRVQAVESGVCCTIPHITCDIARIDRLSELVVGGAVTPATLSDVVSDWL